MFLPYIIKPRNYKFMETIINNIHLNNINLTNDNISELSRKKRILLEENNFQNKKTILK